MTGAKRRLARRLIRLEQGQLPRRARGLAAGRDLGAHRGVGGEQAAVAEHVESRRWNERREPSDEVERVEQDGVGAVLPRRLEAEADAAIGVDREVLLGEGAALTREPRPRAGSRSRAQGAR